MEKLGALVDLTGLSDYHHVFTSAHRLRLLRKMLKLTGAHADECDSMITYADDTIPKRNDLAHVRVVRNGFSRKLFDRSGKELTSDDMQALRVALLGHHELFEKLTASLRTALDGQRASS
jgi:hypothetical protein